MLYQGESSASGGWGGVGEGVGVLWLVACNSVFGKEGGGVGGQWEGWPRRRGSRFRTPIALEQSHVKLNTTIWSMPKLNPTLIPRPCV